MAVSLELVNFDQIFNQLSQPPLIINDVIETSEEQKDQLKNTIFTRYDSDLMKNLPTCDCGEITGEFNIGVFCKNCSTHVTSSVDRNLEPILWMRSPIGVAKIINPMVWTMISNRFSRSGFDVIRWLCDTTYRARVQTPDIVTDIQELGIERGYNYFVSNFFPIINALLTLKKYRVKNKEETLLKLLTEQSDRIFSSYLPLPNRSLLVIEQTNVGIYTDPIVPGAIDAIQTIAGIDSEMKRHSLRTKENRTVKCLAGLAEFYESYFKANLGSKPGIFRQHVYGSRSHFAFRGVVSSITNFHDYDEVHVPWGVGISTLRYHVINKLLKLGYSVNQSIALLNTHARLYHPLLDRIFEELIEESPRKGIEVTMNRNPSLARGSIQLVRITKIKKDPTIPTVSLSIKVVVPLNCDFDGRLLPSLKSFNCWKLLLSTFTTTQSEKTIVTV